MQCLLLLMALIGQRRMALPLAQPRCKAGERRFVLDLDKKPASINGSQSLEYTRAGLDCHQSLSQSAESGYERLLRIPWLQIDVDCPSVRIDCYRGQRRWRRLRRVPRSAASVASTRALAIALAADDLGATTVQ